MAPNPENPANKENSSKAEESNDIPKNNDLESMLDLPQELEEVLDDIPDTKKIQVRIAIEQMMERRISMSHYSGPIPPPETLKGIEDIIPGGAFMVLESALKQGDHRRAMENITVSSQQKQSSTAQWMGYTIAIVFGLIAGILVYTGHDAAGSILGSIDLVSLVSIFVLGKRFQTKEPDSKK